MFAPKVARPQAKDQRRAQNETAIGRVPVRSISDTYWRALSPKRSPGPSGGAALDQADETPARETASGTARNLCGTPVCPAERMGGLTPPFPFQAKLKVGAVNDPLEHEADRVADQVMRMPDSALSLSAAPAQVSRKCAACEEDEKKLQKKSAGSAEAGAFEAPAIVRDVLRSPGQPLDAAARGYFEPRFGHDFGRVRVHRNDQADASARAVQARAFTMGHHIVFGRGEYAPWSEGGRELLAHELAHVIQQGVGDSEQLVQRRLTVDPAAVVPTPTGASGPPTPLTLSVGGLMNSMCPAGRPSVNTTSGAAALGTAGFCDWAGPPTTSLADRSATPAGCNCLCDVINNTETTTVSFGAGGPGTTPGSVAAGVTPAPGQGGATTSPTVNIDPRFQGQYLISGKWVDVPFHLLFAHELCGHARPKMQGTHVARGPTPAGGTPPQEVEAVRAERAIAAEQGLPRRPDDYAGGARQRP